MPNPTEYTSPMFVDDNEAVHIPMALAATYGFGKAHFLQQVHYWLKDARRGKGSKIDANGRPWISRSIPQFAAEFHSLFHERTLSRYRRELAAEGILLQEEEINNNLVGGLRMWYSLNYDRLNEIRAEFYKAIPEARHSANE